MLCAQQHDAPTQQGVAGAIQYGDGRPALSELYRGYQQLSSQLSICLDEIFVQQATLPGGTEAGLPILSLRSPATGPALWVLAGIHGEEPAGPVAIAQNIDLFARLARSGMPFVLLPLCNPKGYLLDWRYPDARRQQDGSGHSVGDCAHLLPSALNPSQPRRPQGPACPEAGALCGHILAVVADYPPVLTIDLHEDELADPREGYVYSQGRMGARDPVAREIVCILEGHGFVAPQAAVTRFGEPIVDGVIAPLQDDSIDQMLSSSVLVRDGQVIPGPGARTVVVVETPTRSVPLARRVAAHAAILRALTRGHEPT